MIHIPKHSKIKMRKGYFTAFPVLPTQPLDRFQFLAILKKGRRPNTGKGECGKEAV